MSAERSIDGEQLALWKAPPVDTAPAKVPPERRIELCDPPELGWRPVNPYIKEYQNRFPESTMTP